MSLKSANSSSFRDPSGYIFNDNGVIKRRILPLYFKQYEALKSTAFYEKLFSNKLLIPHKEIEATDNEIIIEPEQIPFITYPYEWCFNQYKEAALLTLKIQTYALNHGFSLKDASAFNVTFHNGQAIFIDTLSFDFYKVDAPWRAYKQFVMHFLGPILMAKYHGSSALGLLARYIDGIPLKLLASSLPFKTKLNPIIYTNVHLLASFEDKHHEDYDKTTPTAKLSQTKQLKMLTALYDFIKNLNLNEASEWGNYYAKTNYSDAAITEKEQLIKDWVTTQKPNVVFDVGGNDGRFVRVLEYPFKLALVGDIDNTAVDSNYKQLKSNKETNMLPLILDILNPSPAIGFNNTEREALISRIKKLAPDVTLALAVIHHITLSGNVPFERSAHFLASFSKTLIIEFPKREDSWVQRLLQTKYEFKHHFDFYNQTNFETAYATYFTIEKHLEIKDSHRILYLLKSKNGTL